MNTGDRVAWWTQPKRKLGRCTGYVIGMRESPRTGRELVVEEDRTGKHVVVEPDQRPVVLRCYNALQEGDRVRLPAHGEFEELTGIVNTLTDGFLYLDLGPGKGVSEVPVKDPLDEVELLPEVSRTDLTRMRTLMDVLQWIVDARPASVIQVAEHINEQIQRTGGG